jgi:hypothetical protein
MKFLTKSVMVWACLFSWVALGFSQGAKDYSVLLHGKLESVDIRRIGDSAVRLDVKLRFEIVNNGTKPVLFLAAKKPIFPGVFVSKSQTDLLAGETLIRDYYGLSANTSPEWEVLRASMNQSTPPSELLHVLMPNESWSLSDSVSIGMPTKLRENSYYPRTENWEAIHALSVVWFRVLCEVWPLNLETSIHKDDLSFGKELQERWKERGLLWLDEILSEPIMLDLSNIQK